MAEIADVKGKLAALLDMSVEELWRARVSSMWMTNQIERELQRRKTKAEDVTAYDGLIQ